MTLTFRSVRPGQGLTASQRCFRSSQLQFQIPSFLRQSSLLGFYHNVCIHLKRLYRLSRSLLGILSMVRWSLRRRSNHILSLRRNTPSDGTCINLYCSLSFSIYFHSVAILFIPVSLAGLFSFSHNAIIVQSSVVCFYRSHRFHRSFLVLHYTPMSIIPGICSHPFVSEMVEILTEQQVHAHGSHVPMNMVSTLRKLHLAYTPILCSVHHNLQVLICISVVHRTCV